MATTEEREAKLAALREMLDAAIKRGGSYTADEVHLAIEERLAKFRSQTDAAQPARGDDEI